MPSTVTCTQCMQSFSAPDHLAGQQLPCPACTAPIQVPALEPIVVSCSCGGRFQAPADWAGKQTTCPNCQQPLSVPMSNADEEYRIAAEPSGPSRDPLGAAQNPLGAAHDPLGVSDAMLGVGSQNLGGAAYERPRSRAPKRRPKVVKDLIGGLAVLAVLTLVAGGAALLLVHSDNTFALGLGMFLGMLALASGLVATLFHFRISAAQPLAMLIAIPMLCNFPLGTIFAIFLLLNASKPEVSAYLSD